LSYYFKLKNEDKTTSLSIGYMMQPQGIYDVVYNPMTNNYSIDIKANHLIYAQLNIDQKIKSFLHLDHRLRNDVAIFNPGKELDHLRYRMKLSIDLMPEKKICPYIAVSDEVVMCLNSLFDS
jgi:hypothetical protein